MKHFSISAFLLMAFLFFSGCAVKIDPITINSAILPTIVNSKTYNTYDEQQGKITTYYFKFKDGQLQATDEITYIPIDYTDQLYDPFSQVTWTLNRLTNYKAKTIEEALDMSVAKHNFTLLFLNKSEYIIGNGLAEDIKSSIRRFEDMIQRQEDREDRVKLKIFVPLFN